MKEEVKAKPTKNGEDSDDEHLYSLIRGVPTVIIQNNGDSPDDFVPTRNEGFTFGEMNDQTESNERDTFFTVTLMLTNRTEEKESSDDFVPSRENREKKRVKVEHEDENSNNGRVISNQNANPIVKSETSETKSKQNVSSEIESTLEWKKRAERAERLVVELVEEKHKLARERTATSIEVDDLKPSGRRGFRPRASRHLCNLDFFGKI
jgi:hypothetical protein